MFTALVVAMGAIRKYLHRAWWMEKHRLPYYFGSRAEFVLQQRYLALRYQIEVEEGKNFEEEIMRWRRETAGMVRKSGIC